MSTKIRRISILAIRIILGIVFLLSGTGKLLDTGYVNYDIVRLLSTTYFWVIEYAAFIIITISIIELLIAVLLFWGRKLTWAFAAALVMMIGFSSMLGYFYLQGSSVESCGCFGAFGFASGLEFTLIRNFVLVILIVGAFVLMSKPKFDETPEPMHN